MQKRISIWFLCGQGGCVPTRAPFLVTVTQSASKHCDHKGLSTLNSGGSRKINIQVCPRDYYRPQTKFAKVMFLHLSVSHSVHRGDLPQRTPPCAVHAGRYDQQMGGMEPTGMHTWLFSFCFEKKNRVFEKNRDDASSWQLAPPNGSPVSPLPRLLSEATQKRQAVESYLKEFVVETTLEFWSQHLRIQDSSLWGVGGG